jgi:hypothetical protein
MLGAVEVLAVNNFGDTRSGGLAGPMGLFIIVVLIVATVLLIRNMNARLRRLPDHFPDAEAERREAEIARLDADLRLPDATVDHSALDPSRPADRPGPGSDPARPDSPSAHGSPGESTDRP